MPKPGTTGPETQEGVAVERVWDGSDVAQELLDHVRQEVVRLERDGRPPPTLDEISSVRSRWTDCSPARTGSGRPGYLLNFSNL